MSQNISQRLCFYPNQADNVHFLSFPLAPGETLIGSSANCTITLNLPQISLQHCKITITQEGDIKIKCLDTEHGVYRETPSNPRKRMTSSRDIVHLPNIPFYLSNLYKCVIEINTHAPLDSNSLQNGVSASHNNLPNEPVEPENDTGDHLGLSSEVRQTLLLSEADEENHQQTLSENAGDDLDHNSNREYFTNSMAQHLETEDGQNTLVLPEDEEDPDSYVTPQSKNMSRFPESAESGKTQLMSTFGEEGQGTVPREDRGYPTPQSRGTPVTNNEKSKNSSQAIPQEERAAGDLPPTLLLSDEEGEEEGVEENGESREVDNSRDRMEEEVPKPQAQGKQFKAPENKSQIVNRGRGMEEENPEKIEEGLPTQVLTMSLTEDQEPPTQTLPESTQEHGHEENDPIKLSDYDKDNATTFLLYPSQKTEMDIVSAATLPKDEDQHTQLIPRNQSQQQSSTQITIMLPSSGAQEKNNNSGLTVSKDRIERSTTMPIDADDDEEEEEGEEEDEGEDRIEEEENIEQQEDEEEEEIRTTVAMEERESVGDLDRMQETLTLQASQGLSEQHHEDQEEEEIPKSEMTSDRARATTLRDTVRDNDGMSIRGALTPADDYRSVISGFENKSEATTTSGHRAEAPTQRDQSSVREASTPKDEFRSLTSGGRGQARTRIDGSEGGQGPKEEDRRTRSDRSERRDPPTQSDMMEPPSQESTGQILRAKREQINEINKKMGLVGIKAPAALREYFGLESPPPEEKEEAKSSRSSNRNVNQPQYQNQNSGGILNETQIFSPTQNTINMSLNMSSQMSEAEVNITIKTYEGFSDTTSQKVRFKGRGPKVYEASEGYIEEEEKIQKKATTESDTNRDWVISGWLEDDNKKQEQEEREAEKEFTVRKKGRGRSNTTGKKKAPAKSLESDEEEEEYDDGMEPKRKRVHEDRRKSESKKKNNKPESKPKAKPKPKAQPKSQSQPKKTVVKNTKKGKTTKKPWDEEDEEEDEYQVEEEVEEDEEEYVEEIQPKVVKQRGRNNKKVANLKMEEEEEPMKERKGFLLIPPRRIMTRASSKDIPANTSHERKDSLESEKGEIVTTKKKVNKTKKIEKKEEKIEAIVTKKEAVGRRKPAKATQLEEYEEEEEQPQPQPKRRGRKPPTKKLAEDIEVMDTLQKKKEETKSKGKKTTSKGKKKKKELEIKTETYDSLEEVTLSDLELVKRNTFKVMFTGFGKEDHEKVEDAKDTLNRLGIKVVEESAQNFNLLIMDKFKRTIKFLLAINRGIDIVSYRWIEDCLEEEDIMEPRDYIFSDKKAELKYKFKLEKSLKIAKERTNGFLDEYRIFLPNNIKPSFDEVKMLIESADGQVIKSRPTSFQDDLIVVVNDNDDRNIELFKRLGYTPYSTELIYSGVLHQKLDLKLYKL